MSKENPTITKEGLDAIISDVKAELSTVLKSEEIKLETLAKAHPGEETSSEPPADTSAVKTAPESSGPEEAAPSEEEGPSAAPATEAPPAAEEAVEEAPVDPAAEMGPIDPEQLKAEYCQLPLEDLQAHYQACKEALVEAMAAQQPAPAPAPAPAAAPAAAPAPVAAPAPAPAAAPPVPAFKSEEALKIETLEKSLKDQDEAIGKLVTIMTKAMSAPLRKSVTSLTEITDTAAPKVELNNMTKAQLDTALKEKIASGKLSKNETDLIVQFDIGQIKVDALAPLFA